MPICARASAAAPGISPRSSPGRKTRATLQNSSRSPAEFEPAQSLADPSRLILARRTSEMPLEHGGECRGALVTQIERNGGHAFARRETRYGDEQTRLLAPLGEAHAGLASKA